ncbi:MAG: spore germination protein [Clostridiales bacterium]|nr:spore germination protein [Clostridiales bacterium]
MSNKIKFVQDIRSILPIKESFDIVERNIDIGGRDSYLYFIDGFVDSDMLQEMITIFQEITVSEMDEYPTATDFIKYRIPHIQISEVADVNLAVTDILAGHVGFIIEGYDSIILIDLRLYPVRGVEEPEKEKSLRGARDGFVETLIFNTALIRRRIRDPRLVFTSLKVGNISNTDVSIGYIKGIVDEEILNKMIEKINKLDIDTLTVSDQTLVEVLDNSRWLNPFPKIRYSGRPDVVAAHLTEGKFVILVDNSPNAILLPIGFFDLIQDADEFYFPVMTGNFFKFIRNTTMMASVFLTPLYLLVDKEILHLPASWEFILPQEDYALPLFWQFLILEIALDGLNLASLNTPSSLGMSLSVIGALLLGEQSVQAGWFIPQTIVLMAVIALAAFSQPSIELAYANKFLRIFLLIGAHLFSLWGFLIVLVIEILILAFTKTITGIPYLYPLVPFDKKKLIKVLFRVRTKQNSN